MPVVLDAVDEDYRREALGRTGWIFTRWGRKLRPDPLRRLRLDRVPVPGARAGRPPRRARDRRPVVDPGALGLGALGGQAGRAVPHRARGRRTAGAVGGGRDGRGRAHRRPPLRAARPHRRHHAAAGQPADVVAADGLAAVGPRAVPRSWGWSGWSCSGSSAGCSCRRSTPRRSGPFPLPTLLLLAGARARVARRLGGPGSRPGRCATSSGGRREAAAQRDRRRGDGPAGRAGPLGARPASRDARERLEAARPGGSEPDGSAVHSLASGSLPSSTAARERSGLRCGVRSHARSGRCRGAPTPTGNWVEEQQ